MDEDNPTFATLLRHYRRTAGLTQEELAERARLSVRGITDLERSARLSPRKETVQLLANALQLAPVDHLRFVAAARPSGPTSTGNRKEADETAVQPSGGSDAGGRQPADRGPVPAGGFLGAPPAGPLVGREAEMHRVSAALVASAAGQGRLLLLAGEPGVGKTRLAHEAMLRAEEQGFHILVGRCHEQHASLPFFPFTEALSTALALVSPSLRADVPGRFPHLGRLLPDLLPSPPVLEGEDARPRILHAVTGFLTALAAEAPLVLLLEDLHWSDSAGLELVFYLARQIPGARILLLGTYRDVEVNRRHPLEGVLADLTRERLMEEVELRRLSPTDTGALIGAHFGLPAVSSELADLIHGRTEGNPFFIEEVLKALVEQGAIYREENGWERKEVTELEVPRSIRSVVGQRVGRLPVEAQGLLGVASVLGQEWDLELLHGASDLAEETVLEYLDRALAAHLLEERRVGRRDRYAFAHALIGQALYEEIPRHRLRKLHLRAGETLERLESDRPEAWGELARHYLAAGEEDRAGRYAGLAGDHAASLYAHAEAVGHYQAALEVLQDQRNDLGVMRVGEKLGVELRLQGRYDDALAVLGRTADALQAAGDLESLGRVTAEIGLVFVLNGAAHEGARRIQEVLPILEARGPSAALAAMYDALGGLFLFSGRYMDYLFTAERVADLARVLADDRLRALAERHRGEGLEMLGRMKEALRAYETAISLAQAADDLPTLAAALYFKGYVHCFQGQFASATQAIRHGSEVSERLGDPFWLLVATNHHHRMLIFTGQWAEVRPYLKRLMALGKPPGEWGLFTVLLFASGLPCLSEGQWDEASAYLEAAAAHAARMGDLNVLRRTSRALAELDLVRGRPDAARQRLEPLLDRPGLEEFAVTYFLPVLAWAYLEVSDLCKAEQIIDQALRRTRSEDLNLILVEALRVQAMILMRQGKNEDAEGSLREGLALAHPMPYPYAEARLLHTYGRLHNARGELEPARERLGAALNIFHQLGARRDAERVEEEITALE
ncbi:MAG TPA: AAA family ATPase [Chloroflexota bacterium]|nr:AAA family ATPase [Chloroflexota bacterium]